MSEDEGHSDDSGSDQEDDEAEQEALLVKPLQPQKQSLPTPAACETISKLQPSLLYIVKIFHWFALLIEYGRRVGRQAKAFDRTAAQQWHVCAFLGDCL